MIETRSGSGTALSKGNPPAEAMEVDGNNADHNDESSRTQRQEDDVPQETVEEQYQRLLAQVTAKRMREDILAMDTELAGGSPADGLQIAGLSLRQKRPASPRHLNAPPAHRPRLAKPPYYRGRSIKEAAEYEAG